MRLLRWFMVLLALVILAVVLGVVLAESLLTSTLSSALGTPVELQEFSLAWSSPITLKRVTLADPSGTGAMIELNELSIGGGLERLAFSSDALTLSIAACHVHLRKMEGGGSNIETLLGGVASQQESSASAGLPRRIEVTVAEGRLSVDETLVCTFEVAASAEGAPVRGRARLKCNIAGSGSLTAGVLLKSATDAEPACDIEVRGEGVDLQALAPLVRLWADVMPAGKVQRLACTVSLVGAQPQQFRIDAELADFAMGTQTVQARPLPWLKLQGEAHCVAGIPERAKLTLETADARVEVTTPQLQFADHALSGSVKATGTVANAALLVEALPALWPASLRPAGQIHFEAQGEGRWDLEATDWMAQVAAINGSAQVRLAALTTPWAALSAVSANISLQQGVLQVQELAAEAQGAQIQGEVTLPLNAGAVAGSLSIRGALPLHFESAGLRCATTCAGTVRFAGSLDACEVTLDLNAAQIAAEVVGAPPLVLQQATLSGVLHAAQRLQVFRLKNGALRASVPASVSSGSGLGASAERLSLEVASAEFDVGKRSGAAAFIVRAPPRVLRPWLPASVALQGEALVQGSVSFASPSMNALSGEATVSLPGLTLGLASAAADEELTRVRAAARIENGTVTLDSCEAEYCGGKLLLSGGANLVTQPLKASAKLNFNAVALQRDLGAAGSVAAVCTGTCEGNFTANGEFSVRAQVSTDAVQLLADDGRKLALTKVVLSAEAQRAGERTSVSEASLQSAEGWLKVRNAELAVRSVRAEAAWSLDGSWLSAIAESFTPGLMAARGPSTGSVTFTCADFADMASCNAEIKAGLQSVSVSGWELQSVAAEGSVRAGRLALQSLRAGHAGGTLSAEGEFGLTEANRKAGDHLKVTLNDMPLQQVSKAPDAKHEVVTTLKLSGTLEGRRSEAADAVLSAQLKLNGLARCVRNNKSVVKTISLPDLAVQAQGWLRPSGVELEQLSATGEGTSLQARKVQLSSTRLALGEFTLHLPPVFVAAAQAGPEAPTLVQHGEVQAQGALEIAATDWVPDVERCTGRIQANLDALGLGAVLLQGLRCSLELKPGIVQVSECTTALGGGTVHLAPGAQATLQNGCWTATGKVRAAGVDLARVPNRELSILSPLFFLGDQPAEKASVAGKLDLEADVHLKHGAGALWSRTCVADGGMQISGLRLASTAMFLDVFEKLPALFGARLPAIGGIDVQGAVASVQAALAQGVAMDKLVTSVRVREGRVSLDKGLQMPMTGLMLTMDGWTSLDGMVNCRIGTDVIERLASKIGGGQGPGALLGALLAGTGALKRMSLGIEIRGNVMAADGRRTLDIQPVLGGN